MMKIFFHFSLSSPLIALTESGSFCIIKRLSGRSGMPPQEPAPKKRKDLIVLKSTGIVRKVDELGRIVLPIELRRTLDIAEKDSLEIYMDGASIVLKKYQPACIFCDDAQDVISYRGKNVCTRCIKALQEAGE